MAEPPSPLDLLDRLRAQADALFAQTFARHPQHFRCRAGCSSCCQGDLTISHVEARALTAALRALPPNHAASLRAHLTAYAADPDASACALLIDHQCAAYDARPLICRTHGMPIRFTDDDGAVFLDVCPLNFTDDPDLSSLSPFDILDLDRLNTTLTLLNRLDSPASPLAPRASILSAALAAFNLTDPSEPPNTPGAPTC
jgi:hypothetical protein